MILEKLLEKKVIFITGKGGVGKSTVSSALAYGLAEQGNKVLAIDADPAHSLPDTFGISSKVYKTSEGFLKNGRLIKVYDDLDLDLLLLNPVVTRDKYEGTHRIMWLGELGKELGFYSNLARMSEFFTLADFLWRSYGTYDKIVIDNEPSAGTLDMIESIDGWVKGLDNVRKYKTVFDLMLGAGIVDKELAREARSIIHEGNGSVIGEYKGMLRAIKGLFTDGETLEPIIVSSPEDAVIRETHRLRRELEDRLGIPNRYVVFNKVTNEFPVGEQQREKIELFMDQSETDCLTIPYFDPKTMNLQEEETAIESLRAVKDGICDFKK